MAPSFKFYEWSLNEWRDRLRDIDFWRSGYRDSRPFRALEDKLDRYYPYVLWNVGVGPTACFTRAISSIAREGRIRRRGPFDHVIDVDMKQAAPTGLRINEKLAIKVAEQLGLLDQEYDRLKEQDAQLRYYSYDQVDGTEELQKHLRLKIVPQIIQTLITKKYLLVLENLDEPIKPIELDVFTEGVCLPPPSWNYSSLLLSTTSQKVYAKSKSGYGFGDLSGDDILILTLYSLHQAAKYISGAVGHEDEQYWHQVALWCFHYAATLLVPHGDGDQQSCSSLNITSDDELIRQWAAQGIVLPIIKPSGQERMGEVTDIYQVGNVILEAFREYSLLQKPISPATTNDEASASTDDEAFASATHFLAHRGLIADCLTTDELCEDNHPGLERMQWISHVGDKKQGWHVSREWLSQGPGASGPTALIIRHCSQQSRILAELDHFLAKVPCLRVLDLSYTPIQSLPLSLCSLHKLQLLSLRGCHNLTNPFNFPDTEMTLFENNSNRKLNLLYLDLSYSNIHTFHCDFFGSMPNLHELLLVGCSNLMELPPSISTLSSLTTLDLSYSNIHTLHCDFFRSMPNLHELLLVRCSNLVELPPSISALFSLTTLELTGTQIKSFDGVIFEEMKKLQSIKLVDNKKLLPLLGSISKARGLIKLHIEGWTSSAEEEITLYGHPTLRSFSLIDAPHIRQLSLRGCAKLESVDIKGLDALEEIDLSATAIKELPADIPNLPQLRRLLLMGVPSLRRFPWHRLQRLPDVFFLDQCSDRIIDHSNPQVAAQVCISDSRLFYSFRHGTRDLVRDGRFLKYFYIRVASCKAGTGKIEHEEDMVTITNKLQASVSTYADVNRRYLTDGVSMVPMNDVPSFRKTERHVEISAVDRYPYGLMYLLQVTKSISMTDDTHVACLQHLSYLAEPEEIKLRRCHRMERVFNEMHEVAKALKNACVSYLKSLTHFCSPWAASGNFHALKHLRLEHCPRLEGVVPRGCELPSLVTLDILFCYNLKAILYNDYRPRDRYQLPCLRRMHLQELPQLEHLRVDDAILTAPTWEELHVRGCWSLRRLPRLHQEPAKAVKVSGERAWWAKLRWDRDPHRGSYEPRLPPAIASVRERVIIKSYLR